MSKPFGEVAKKPEKMASFGDKAELHQGLLSIGQSICNAMENCQIDPTFDDLAHVLKSTRLCLESMRHSLDNIWDSLPLIHQRSLTAAMDGLKDIVKAISNDLEYYVAGKDLQSKQMSMFSQFKFAMLENTVETEAKLKTRLSLLNTSMQIVLLYVTYRSLIQHSRENDL